MRDPRQGTEATSRADDPHDETTWARASRWIVIHPRRVVAVWIAIAAVLLSVGPSLSQFTSSDQAGFLPDRYDSVRANAAVDRAFPEAADEKKALIVVTRGGEGKLQDRDAGAVERLVAGLRAAGIEGLSDVTSGPQDSAPDGGAQLVNLAFSGENEDDALEAVRDRVPELLDGTGLRGGVTGDVAIAADSEKAFADAETIISVVTIGLILTLLLLIFRSPLAALLPVVAVVLVFAVATKLIAVLADVLGFEVSPSLNSILLVVLFGVGTDYVLFLLFRVREQLRDGSSPRESVVHGLTRVGEAIGSSALVVVAAFAALLFASLEDLRALGPGIVVSVSVMLVASVTLVPALMALLGTRLFWPSKAWQKEPTGPISARTAALVAARPGRVALATSLALLAAGIGALSFQPSFDAQANLPDDAPSKVAYDDLQRAFPAGLLSPTTVVVDGANLADPAVERNVTALAERLNVLDGVAGVLEPTVATSGRTLQLPVVLEADPTSVRALDLASGPVRDTVRGAVPGAQTLVTGESAAYADVRSAINRDYTVVFPIAAALILLILAGLLRSLVSPMVLVAGVSLCFAATLGSTVLLVEKLGGTDLGFDLPITLYLFVVAIGTDYNILVVTRLREELRHGRTPAEAARIAVRRSASTVAAAAVILAGTFASLALTGVGSLVSLGLAVAVGIVIAAFPLALLLVPATLTLLGRRSWWPRDPGAGTNADLPSPGEAPRPTQAA